MPTLHRTSEGHGMSGLRQQAKLKLTHGSAGTTWFSNHDSDIGETDLLTDDLDSWWLTVCQM